MAEQKQRFIRWTLDAVAGVLTATFKMTSGAEKIENFDIKLIFPNWSELNLIQQHCVLTGLKPKLEDTTAADKTKALTALERWQLVTGCWKRLTVEKIWSVKAAPGERQSIGKLNASLSSLDEEAKEQLAALPESVKAAMRAAGVVI